MNEYKNIVNAPTMPRKHPNTICYDAKTFYRVLLNPFCKPVWYQNQVTSFITSFVPLKPKQLGKGYLIPFSWLKTSFALISHRENHERGFAPRGQTPVLTIESKQEHVYLNHALKLDVHSGNLPVSAADIDHKIRSFMARIQLNTAQVKAFFRHHGVSYISLR